MAQKFSSAASQGKSAISWTRKNQRTDISTAAAATAHAVGTHEGGMYSEGPSKSTAKHVPSMPQRSGGAGKVITPSPTPNVHQARQSSNSPRT